MRVYDKQENKWMPRDEFFMSCFDGDLYHVTKTMFGNYKMELVSSERYITHQCLGFSDMDGSLVYEGDICDATLPDKHIHVIVIYIPERSGFFLIDYDNSSYYSICESTGSIIKVIGNVFDGITNPVANTVVADNATTDEESGANAENEEV